jgi:hypothetical protein
LGLWSQIGSLSRIIFISMVVMGGIPGADPFGYRRIPFVPATDGVKRSAYPQYFFLDTMKYPHILQIP